MDKAKIVEVKLGVRLLALLVHEVISRDVILLHASGTSSVSLKVFLIDPKGLHALVDCVSFQERPSFKVSEHSEVLSYSRKVDFFFEADKIIRKVALVIKRFG